MEVSCTQRNRALVIALLTSLVMWNLPFAGLLLYPFKLLATWLHEISHGTVMLLTGAGFDYMEIYRDTSGLAYAKYGITGPGAAFISSAGYMGTPLFGAILLVVGRSHDGARKAAAVIGIALTMSALIYVRNEFGLVVTLIGAGVCFTAAIINHREVALLLVSFVAVQSCINAVLDIRVLFRSNLVVNGEVMGASDAHNMAAATFGSAWMWAAIWLLWSFALFYAALRMVYLREGEQSELANRTAMQRAHVGGPNPVARELPQAPVRRPPTDAPTLAS